MAASSASATTTRTSAPTRPEAPSSALPAAIELASDVEGLRLVLASTLGDRYRARVSDDESTVGLWGREAC